MAIEYNWDCQTVDYYPEKDDHSDVVFNVHWRINAVSDQKDSEDNFYAASVYGTQSLNVDDIENFIPYADLTNEIVTGWVEGVMGEEEVKNLKDNLAKQIADLIDPKVVTGHIGS